MARLRTWMTALVDLRGEGHLSQRRFGDEAVAHLAQTLDLGLHDIADFEEAVGALADAATGPATENVAGFERKNARGVFDLLFGREDELRGVAVLLDLAIDGEADEQVHMVGHEGARTRNGPIGAKLSWLLPPSQSERSAGRSARI